MFEDPCDLDCKREAIYHVWLNKEEFCFVCGHCIEEVQELMKPWKVHKKNPICGLPGTTFDPDLNECLDPWGSSGHPALHIELELPEVAERELVTSGAST